MNIVSMTVPGCTGTEIQELFSIERMQILKVDVKKDSEIPVHTHRACVTMIVLSGKAKIIGAEHREVKKGDVMVIPSCQEHGFTEVKDDLSFISIVEGNKIIDGGVWDMRFHSAT